jgi:peptidoglycan L-alanyl-D-glutamate endopeptidase CwlK
MAFKLSQRSLDRLIGVEPILISIVKEAIKESPYDFGIPPFGGKRTADEQHGLFLKKVSKADGYVKKSYHQSGKAFDIFIYIDGKPTWDKKYYPKVARHIQKVAKEKFDVSLVWGGDWTKFVDMPHFEIR